MVKNVPHVISFPKRFRKFDFTCSLNDSFWTAINNASNFSRVPFSLGESIRISKQTSDWCYWTSVLLVQFFLLGCYVHSNVFLLKFLSVSLMYFSLHWNLSTSALFSHKKDLNSDFPSLVIHLIAILQRLLVNASNFLIKCLEAFLFSS